MAMQLDTAVVPNWTQARTRKWEQCKWPSSQEREPFPGAECTFHLSQLSLGARARWLEARIRGERAK